jgi:6-phosphogluconolactonase
MDSTVNCNKVKREIEIFSSPEALADKLAGDMAGMIKESSDKNILFTMALSGGNTPKFLFPVLADRLKDSVAWEKVHIFWVDERCVPAGDPESNYGMTKSLLIDRIKIPAENIHRIIGEAPPTGEVKRYSAEIADFTVPRRRLPVFDLILLGLGDDGHTASIFPGNEKLFNSDKVCGKTVHPVTHQNRITITGSVINNAAKIFFIVTGGSKAKVVSATIDPKSGVSFPASRVLPLNGVLKWYLDEAAAGLIVEKEKINNN